MNNKNPLFARCVNLTAHQATSEQVDDGVADLPEKAQAELRRLMTFNEIPDAEHICQAAKQIAALASAYADFSTPGYDAAMIGGAPYLMEPLVRELKARGIKPVFAFSRRESIEKVQEEDGSVQKASVFQHSGFVEAVESEFPTQNQKPGISP